nr:hypothetical protein [uncultured Holophaga sp.]
MTSQSFDTARNHQITRQEAADLVLGFQAKLDAGYHYASAFNRSAFEQLLAQPGAAGIRIYRAEHADGSPTMVMVAVDADGVDMDAVEGLYMQNAVDCPPICKGAGLAKS